MLRYRTLILTFVLISPSLLSATISEAPAQGAAPLITPQRLKQLEVAAIRIAPTTKAGSLVTVPLGLSKSGAIPIKQLGDDTPEGKLIFIAPYPSIGKYLFVKRKDDVTHIYVCDSNGKLLTAGMVVNGVFSAISLQAATVGFETLLRHWADAELPTE